MKDNEIPTVADQPWHPIEKRAAAKKPLLLAWYGEA